MNNKLKILLVEDEPKKENYIVACLKDDYPDAKIIVKRSFKTALSEICTNYRLYDFILLDMSLSSFDNDVEPSGGNPMAMAGRSIMERMDIREIKTKVIVVTMHERFDQDLTLVELDNELKDLYSDFYFGYVYFSYNSIDWKNILLQKIKQLICAGF